MSNNIETPRFHNKNKRVRLAAAGAITVVASGILQNSSSAQTDTELPYKYTLPNISADITCMGSSKSEVEEISRRFKATPEVIEIAPGVKNIGFVGEDGTTFSWTILPKPAYCPDSPLEK